MENSLLEIFTYYIIGGALLVGAPGIFSSVFMPALQNTKVHGRLQRLQDYGNSSITKTPLVITPSSFLNFRGDIYGVDRTIDMPNPDALWQDIQKLDDMYEELMWHLTTSYNSHTTVKSNYYYKQNTREKTMFNEKAEKLNGRSNGRFRRRCGSYLATGQVIPGLW